MINAFSGASKFLLGLALCGVLTACSDTWFGAHEAPPLPGERLSVMQLQTKLIPQDNSAPFVEPDRVHVKDWAQVGGGASHRAVHAAFQGGDLKEIWRANMGAGSRSSSPLTARPVVAQGRIFTLDTLGHLSAFDINSGTLIWDRFVGSLQEEEISIGGGIGVQDDIVFVSNGYPELLAAKVSDGTQIWRTALPAPVRAAPTILDGVVYVTTVKNQVYALGLMDGKPIWSYQGFDGGVSLVGAAAPAATPDLVVVPFSSGEILGLRPANGAVAWADNLSPTLRLGGVSAIADIHALPVVTPDGMVLVMTYAGRLVALNAQTGLRVWQREFGGIETPLSVGDYVFALTGDQQVVSMDRADGHVRWVTPLEAYENPEERRRPILWTGPLYAGGRLILAGSNGHIVHLSPETGKVVKDQDIGDKPAVPLVLVGDRVYMVTTRGYLVAFE